ncbi:MAG: MaoC family dehydratase [Candidatus Dormibacteria bacterium]
MGAPDGPFAAAAEPAPATQRLTQERIDAYARASGDHNPIHLDPAAARAAGLPSTIAHGLLTLGVACARIEAWGGAEAWVQRVSCRFAATVPAGEELTCRARVASRDADQVTLELEVRIGSGEPALSRARAELRRRA